MEGPSKFWCSLGQNHHFFLRPWFHIKVSTNYSIPSTSLLVFNMNWGKVLEMVDVMWNRWSGFWVVGDSLTEICDDGNRFQLFDEVLLLCLEGLWKKKINYDWLLIVFMTTPLIITCYIILLQIIISSNFQMHCLCFCALLYCFHE